MSVEENPSLTFKNDQSKVFSERCCSEATNNRVFMVSTRKKGDEKLQTR